MNFMFIFALFVGAAAAGASYYALHQKRSYFDGLRLVEIDHPIFDRMTVIRADRWEDLAFVILDDSPTAIAVDIKKVEGKNVIRVTGDENLLLVLTGEIPLFHWTINEEFCWFVYYEAFQI